jgi:hypothetical protein
MGWYVVPAVRSALDEATRRWPNRSRTSDGTIGDVKHSSRTSDHNPRPDDGAVTAFDLTHDPANGCDAHALVRAAAERGDPRIKYAISNRRIWSYARRGEGWRPYRGPNPHEKHAHVSVARAHEDDTSAWWPVSLGDRLLRKGDKGPDVAELQTLLGITADGDFGPHTDAALRSYQTALGLDSDGVCGPATLTELRTPREKIAPMGDDDMPVIARGSGSKKYLTDLGTWKRWVRSQKTVDGLVQDGNREVQGEHYDGVLADLPEGPEIP